MPYKLPDLSGGGRDIILTANTQYQFSAAAAADLPNSEQMAASTVATVTAPGFYHPDTSGFFALPWGAADEALTVECAVRLAATSVTSFLVAWGDPGDTTSGWNIHINATEQIVVRAYDTGVGNYLIGTSAVLAAGFYLVHAEFRTGATRTTNLWLNCVPQALTVTGPTGSPSATTGNERLTILAHHDTTGADSLHWMAKPAIYKRRLTAAERDRHLAAIMIA